MHGESRQRSQLGEGELVAALQAAGVRQLVGAEEAWVVLDNSDLRKPGAQAVADGPVPPLRQGRLGNAGLLPRFGPLPGAKHTLPLRQ